MEQAAAIGANMPPADVLRAANVNPDSGLATDYLNVFNEALMLLELAATAPEMLDELTDWSAPSYVEHFERSAFQGRAVVVAAWQALPAARRSAFEAEAADLARIITTAITALQDLQALNAELAPAVEHACDLARDGIARLDALVHGVADEAPNAQDAIDALFD